MGFEVSERLALVHSCNTWKTKLIQGLTAMQGHSGKCIRGAATMCPLPAPDTLRGFAQNRSLISVNTISVNTMASPNR